MAKGACRETDVSLSWCVSRQENSRLCRFWRRETEVEHLTSVSRQERARARERENRRGPKHNPVEHNSLSLDKIEVATCRQRGARGYYHYTGNQEVTLHGQYGQNGQRPKSHASPHKSSYFAQRQPYQATTEKQRSGRRKEKPMKPASMMAAWTGGMTDPPRIAMIRPAAPILASSPTSSRAIP